MIAKKESERVALREGGHLLAKVLSEVVVATVAGIKTKSLDEIAENGIRDSGGEPSFKHYRSSSARMPYPASLCVSINDEIVHGIPSDRVLKNGDVVGLDIGMKYKGLFTDMAVTVGVGDMNEHDRNLIHTTKQALKIGIEAVRVGGRIGDIGHAVERYLKSKKLGVIRELVGHGVGLEVHEDPEVPNWGKAGTGQLLIEGMVLALEPMATLGLPEIRSSPDGWVWTTKDGKRAAHFEHTILLTENGPEIITR